MKQYKVEVTDDGSVYWKNLDGEFHREEGPAIEWGNGTKKWYINDKLHREDGPAIEWRDGTKSWYIEGINYSEQEFNKKILKNDMKHVTCEGRVVEIDGVTYKLTLCK